MDKIGLSILLFFGTAVVIFSVATAQTCSGCNINCRFNNVEILTQLIEAEVDRALNRATADRDEPLVRFLVLGMSDTRQLRLYSLNHSATNYFSETLLATVSVTNVSQAATSSNNLLAYRPNYNDHHNSNLAGIFINLEGVFPCIVPLNNDFPIICHLSSAEEDGFRHGKALIGSGDIGNHFQIFSSTTTIVTYGIAVQDCPELNNTCFPTYQEISVVCYLPRAACSG